MRSARALKRHAEDLNLPLILAGDFNASLPGHPGGPDGSNVKDSAVAEFTKDKEFIYAPQKHLREDGMTFPSTEPRSIIDWILIPKDFSFRSYRVIHSTLSDHRMVAADIVVPKSARRVAKD